MTEPMNPEVRDLWADALESGEYRQGVGRLRSYANDERSARFCCLGVLCELARARGLVEVTDRGGYRTVADPDDGEYVSTLPSAVARWAGLRDVTERRTVPAHDPWVDGHRLSEHNDNLHRTFVEIAALIRGHL